jgi:hydroxymethylglutaryl-CoA lyase
VTPRRVSIVEVGPRDGLQNEHVSVSTADKIAFVNRLSAAHLPVIEVSAFVSPKWVPQLADAAEVFAGIAREPATRYTALVPNLAGLDRAMAAGVTEIAVFAASTETFSRKNINQTIDDSLAVYKQVCDRALGAGLRVRGYLSTAFGCPFEGEVAPDRVADAWIRSRCTFTTRGAPRSPTCSPRCRTGSGPSTPRPADSAGVRTRPAPPATSRPMI